MTGIAGDARRRWPVAAGWIAAALMTGALTLLAARADLAPGGLDPWATAVDLAVGLAFVGGAALAQATLPGRLLFWAVGLAWLVGSFLPVAQVAYLGVLAIALGLFPNGRPRSLRQWLLVVFALPVAVLVPINPVLAGLFVAVTLSAWAVRRWERAAWAFPATTAGALACLLAAHVVAEHQQSAGFDQAMWLLAHEALLVAIAAGFPLAAWAVARERATLADRLLADEHPAGLNGLAEVLAATLGEPQLRVFRWDRKAGSYIDRDGRAAAVGNDASVIAVNDGDERLAVVAHHRPTSMQDPVAARAVAEAVRLAALNERWQAALEEQLAELEAARGRLLAVTDRQRVVTAARLRDDVVRLMESAVAVIHNIDARTASPGTATGGADALEAHDALRVAGEELAASIDEVLALTDGLPPAGLGEGGLHLALQRLAERSPIPVALTLAPDAATDPDRETALFYVCSEAIANTIKHARASHVSIDLRRERGGLALVVADDGMGGAQASGFGLRGLADRLAAYGGRLRVDSPPGAGTTLTARIGL